MHWWRSLLALTTALWWSSIGWSIIIDPARPITHRVNVRLIETALSNGTFPATVLGNPLQRAEIEANVDAIWAQAGIDVNFLPSVVRYNNTFAYQGDVSPGTIRPIGDLNLVIRGAQTSRSILHPDDSVINMFMVHVAPGFNVRGEGWAGGLANVGGNGIMLYVGDNLLTSTAGRESVSTLLAHEIGHNLGLQHAADGTPNLMASKRMSAQLSSAQIDAILQWQFRSDSIAYIPQGGPGFLESIPNPLAGDFTRNGVVDAADYSLWRNTLGSKTLLAADGNGNSIVDQGDYSVWKNDFGRSVLPQDLPGDYNRNGVVDAGDYSLWRNTLGSATNLSADGNRNLVVDAGDYGVWKSNFGRSLLPQQLSGDYNRDGTVDAADYSVWRDSFGSTTNLVADGNGNLVVDEGDYNLWKSNFGAVSESGSGSALSTSVPEPAAMSAFAIAIGIAMLRRRRSRR